MVIWDIETEPLPVSQLEAMMPEFDPASVKLGNMKDEVKIKDKIEKARLAHQDNFVSRAALSATTGCVLAIGYYRPSKNKLIIDGVEKGDAVIQEQDVIDRFWKRAQHFHGESIPMIGLNIHDFDLPFLIRRSWILEVDIPDWVVSQDRYFHPIFVDLRKRWLCGQRPDSCKSSFDELGRAFGSNGKTDGVTGADFAHLWWSDRPKAVEYLTNDVKQPVEWANKMGIY